MACTAPQVPVRLASGQTVCLFPTGQAQAAAAGASGIQASVIKIGETTLRETSIPGPLGPADLALRGSGAPIKGLVGELLLPVALIGQQIALNAALPGVGRLAIAAADLAQQIEQRARTNMGLNLSGILGAVGQAASGINTSGFGNISQIIGTGLNIASAALAPAPANSAPFYGPAPSPIVATMAPAVRASSSMLPMMVGSMSLVRQITQPILFKIAATLGKRGISLSSALNMIKRLGKVFSSPEAIAVYLGISVSEMAQLITANASRKRRTMNPANTKALRRSLRRLKSFDRLAGRVSVQLGRAGRRRAGTRRTRCGTCRQSPCSC